MSPEPTATPPGHTPVRTPDGTPARETVLAPDVSATSPASATEPGEPTLAPLTESLRSNPAVESVGITILAVLGLVYTLYFARAFFVPIFFAVELNFLLSPAIRAARRIGLPAPLSAAIVLLALTALLGFGIYELAGPARGWIASAPVTLSRAGAKLQKIIRPVQQVSRTAEQMAKAGSVTGGNSPQQVVVAGPSLVSRFFGTGQSIVVRLLEVLVLLYFLLSAGDLFLQKLIKVLPQLKDKRKAVLIARETEASISLYLLTSALLFLVEGAAVALVLYLLGMPNALLWGAMVVVLEFIPYVGAATIVAVLTIAALTVFDNVARALVIPASFIAINMLQANFVGPVVLGHRLSLNPVAIFIGVAFWWEVWGIAGAFLAVPMLATFKILCDNIETLAPIGEFLGQRDEEERRLAARA